MIAVSRLLWLQWEYGGIQRETVSGWPVPALKTVIDTPGGNSVDVHLCKASGFVK
jgi:hypothetical protein